ncbi:MAG TPA: serine hydrolase domain-containing protein [Pseudomonadales bacterium]
MRTCHRLFAGALLGAAALAFFPSATAQTASPESVGMSSERLTRIEALMQRHIEAKGFAGAVTLVARDNEIVWHQAQGVMDVDSGRPMQKDAVFRIMSMTKPLVAFSVMMMVEEGKVGLNDPVAKYIPELGNLRVASPGNPQGIAAERQITVKDILTHSSGLMSGEASNASVAIEFTPGATLASILPQLGASQLEFQPGTRWAYSAMYGLDVAARIVEITSGVDFGTFTREKIFGPLGMDDTFFYRDTPHPDLATLYRVENGNFVPMPEMFFANGSYFSGGGGLYSTAEDYLQFALVMMNDGELDDTRLLGTRTLEIMRAAHLPDTLPGRNPGEGYGLGVRVITDPVAEPTWLSEGSFGWSGLYNTHFFVDPQERVVGIYMTQVAGFPGAFTLMDEFETAVMQALVETPGGKQ